MHDLVVIGGGHAGCEAAAAAARMGLGVVLVTLHRETMAQMPCNPAIGGVGKGHLVAEVDALGGLQGWASDRAGIQFRVLNSSRGPAVWGPRAQCDKARYSLVVRRVVERLRGLEVREGEVTELLSVASRVVGVRLADGTELRSRQVLITAGTFLGGLLHTGPERRPGGRHGERPSLGLGDSLRELGLEVRRFKTGTPPRLDRRTLDYARMERQDGDPEPRAFSWRTREVRNRAACWLTRTPRRVQRIVMENLDRSPLYAGQIEGTGPRYCPSIEDKVVRFPEHEEHTLFVEPEGVDGDSMYVNGLSTSLPRDVQEEIVWAVPGLERARFLRFGYAVEYDVVASTQVSETLACRDVEGLWLAGQVLGTSGYEEAAAQGLIAGINIALRVRGEGSWVPGSESSYIGVLVRDLSSRQQLEPYRMLTSRAEHRLSLGVDSARERLMAAGVRWGLVQERAFHVEQERAARRNEARDGCERERLRPDRATREWLLREVGVEIERETTWAGLLRRQDVDLERAALVAPPLAGLPTEDRRVVIGRLQYAGYLRRVDRDRERIQRLRGLTIPPGWRYERLPGLSREAIEALVRYRPATVGEAEGLPGLTPAALAALVGHLTAGSTTAR